MLFGQPRSSGYDVNGMTSFRDCFLLIKRDDGEVGTTEFLGSLEN